MVKLHIYTELTACVAKLVGFRTGFFTARIE